MQFICRKVTDVRFCVAYEKYEQAEAAARAAREREEVARAAAELAAKEALAKEEAAKAAAESARQATEVCPGAFCFHRRLLVTYPVAAFAYINRMSKEIQHRIGAVLVVERRIHGHN